MFNVEFLHSGPDCIGDVPSLGVEVDFAPQCIRLSYGSADNVFPCIVVRQKHAVVFSPPSFAAVCPVDPGKMEYFPQGHHFVRLGDRFPGILVDSGLPVGTYTLRTEIDRRSGSLEFERPVLVRSRTFKKEDISLNQAMSNLRSSEDPVKLEQSRRLWAILVTVGEGSASPCESMISPVDSYIMTSWFGDRRNFLYTDGGTAGSVHTGVDMAADTGTPIVAPLGGKVVLAEDRVLTGFSIVLEHFPGVYSLYYHLDTLDVQAGDILVPGDSLGSLGATGLVTGPHLHWELRVNTIPVDPMRYLDKGLIDKDEIMVMIDATIQEGR